MPPRLRSRSAASAATTHVGADALVCAGDCGGSLRWAGGGTCPYVVCVLAQCGPGPRGCGTSFPLIPYAPPLKPGVNRQERWSRHHPRGRRRPRLRRGLRRFASLGRWGHLPLRGLCFGGVPSKPTWLCHELSANPLRAAFEAVCVLAECRSGPRGCRTSLPLIHTRRLRSHA